MVKKIIYLVSLLCLSIVVIELASPQVVATLGLSAATANQIVSVINAYGTASFAISLVLAITGAGASISAFVATIYAFIRKKGTRYAVNW